MMLSKRFTSNVPIHKSLDNNRDYENFHQTLSDLTNFTDSKNRFSKQEVTRELIMNIGKDSIMNRTIYQADVFYKPERKPDANEFSHVQPESHKY